MQDSAKYLIHAQITANGVVERSDVVGAIFGQTEGLLGDELDIRELQESAKLGRIDVEIDSEGGQSFGEVTIASGLDRVETAILAASLETIERVGPCRATVEVTDLEDVRQAKRREVVERATQLVESFDETVLSSQQLVDEVRKRARVERITDYEGYPAGPRVDDSDAIIVVEGRSDVLCLLEFGIKNAVAVEGTDVPEAVAELTAEKTVTAFLDGDRGGELILRELAQVGDIDYVAFAPEGKSVEDLDREEVMSALRDKVEYGAVEDDGPPDAITMADGASVSRSETGSTGPQNAGTDTPETTDAESTTESDDETRVVEERPADTHGDEAIDNGEVTPSDGDTESESDTDEADQPPMTLSDHITSVVEAHSGTVRLLDDGLNPIDERPAEEAFEALEGAEEVPQTAIVDGPVDQRVLDIAAQRGVDRVIASEKGQFVKKPTAVHLTIVA